MTFISNSAERDTYLGFSKHEALNAVILSYSLSLVALQRYRWHLRGEIWSIILALKFIEVM